MNCWQDHLKKLVRGTGIPRRRDGRSPKSPWSSPGCLGLRLSVMAFTLTEMLVSMAVFLMVIGAVISGHLLGLRMMELSKSGIQASDDFVRQFSVLSADLGSARRISVGQGSRLAFTEVPGSAPQQGSALQIYLTLDTNRFIRYYLDAANGSLQRLDENDRSSTLADNLTNLAVFALEDFAGRVLTNKAAHAVVVVRLEFNTLSGASVPLGPGHNYTSYRRQFKVTSRALE